MTMMTREISKYSVVLLSYRQTDLAASQSAVALSAGSDDAITGHRMAFSGWIIGMSAPLSAAATAGTLTIAPAIDGVAAVFGHGPDVALSISTATGDSVVGYRDASAFAKDAVLGVDITTDAQWDATSADLSVLLHVLLDLEGLG